MPAPGHKQKLTVVIPSYNDAEGLKGFLAETLPDILALGWSTIIVNDGSTDHTSEVLKPYRQQIKVIVNRENSGYGFSLKRGFLAAATEWVACMDADGQHRLEDLKKMYEMMDPETDAVIGERVAASHAPVSRKPGKWLLLRLAHLLTGEKINDINCGLRIMRRDIVLQLFSITSNRFSFSTSTTVAMIQLDCNVKFFPVLVQKRIGKSTVRQVRDGFDALLRIICLVFLFQPLRVVMPLGVLILAIAFFGAINDLILTAPAHITSSTLLMSVSGLIVFFMALLADQVSGLRRDLLLRDIKLKQMHADSTPAPNGDHA